MRGRAPRARALTPRGRAGLHDGRLARDGRRIASQMELSLGIDIIEVDRLRQALQRRPTLAARLFTERERAYCERKTDPAPHYAARFAAKEAAAKAFGRWLRWQEVEVLNDTAGRPTMRLHGGAAALGGAEDGARLLVSLSHGRDYAVAAVLALGAQETGASDQNLPGCGGGR